MIYQNKFNKYYIKYIFNGGNPDYKKLYEQSQLKLKEVSNLAINKINELNTANQNCNNLLNNQENKVNNSDIWKGREVELQLYIPQIAGESENIWPIITKNWKKTKLLGIKNNTDSTINFLFVPNNIGKNDEPILGRGTFTAVYELKNEYNQKDLTKYILRLYERDLDISNEHMMHNSKIESEYNNYGKYLIKNFYYGEFKIYENEFKYIMNNRNSDLDMYKFLPNMKQYKFDYIITKIYNTPTFDNYYHVTDLTNMQKFAYLYNNIVMLDDLAKNNSFHADYKIENIGWENPEKMNVILIDYDIDTIQSLNSTNKKIVIDKNGNVTSLLFPSTFIPEYIKTNNSILSIPYQKYIKYSVGGLNQIIKTLNISFNTQFVKLPSTVEVVGKIYTLNLQDLSTSLQLTSKNYDKIPTYSEMRIILNWLFISKLVV